MKDTPFSKLQTLEEESRFSECALWGLQTAAYKQFGPKAWSHAGVPFYITSNPYIARQYAMVVLGFLRDCLQGRGSLSFDPAEPLYFFDLGAGSGRFCYLFLKHLLRFKEELGFKDVKIKYVMTDIVQENINYWSEHPKLKPYFENQILDSAFYDVEQDSPINLLCSNKVLDAKTVKNPIIILANYFFDTVKQDLFKTKNGDLLEGRVTIGVEDSEIEDPNDPALIENLQFHYSYHPIENIDAYYDEKILNEILKYYAETFDEVPFLFPSGAFQALRYFEKMAHGRMLLLAGDQGVCTEKQISAWGEPKVSKHATFSIPVSYHALGEYFIRKGGEGLLASHPDTTFAVIAGMMAGETSLKETRFAFQEYLEVFEPQDYWAIVNCVEKEIENLTVEHMLLLLKFGNWDPSNFHFFFEKIKAAIPNASDLLKSKIKKTIEHVWEFLYPVSHEEADVILNMGVLCVEMQAFEEAVTFFKRTIEINADHAGAYFNLGVCFNILKKKQAALQAFVRAEELDPNFSIFKENE